MGAAWVLASAPLTRPLGGVHWSPAYLGGHISLFCRISSRALCHDFEHVVWEWPLEFESLLGRRVKPDIVLLRCRQENWHSLRMDRFDDAVWLACQERIEQVLAFDRVGLGPSYACPGAPDPGKSHQRTVFRLGKPDWCLTRLRVSVFAETGHWNERPVLRLEPSPPEWGGDISHVGDWVVADFGGRWEAPAHLYQLPSGVGIPHDWCHLIREYRRKGRNVSCSVTLGLEGSPNRLLGRKGRIKIAHGRHLFARH